MALELNHALGLGALEELFVQRGILEREGHVHARTVLLAHRVGVEARRIDAVVEHFRLGDVLLFHGCQAALLLEPLEHQASDVDAIGRRRVVHRVVVGVGLVVEHGLRRGNALADQVVANDDDGQPGRTDVLLRAGVDQAVLADIDGLRQDVRRHVAHQRHVPGVRRPVEFDAADGLVAGVMHVGGFLVELPVLLRRRIGEFAVLAAGDDIDLAEGLGRLDGLLRPLAGMHVVGTGLAGQQVHRDHLELQRGAALQEQHLVVGGNCQQFAQIGFRLGVDAHVFLAAMAHFHHRLAAAVPVEQFVGGLLENDLGQCRGSCAEIEDACHNQPPEVTKSIFGKYRKPNRNTGYRIH